MLMYSLTLNCNSIHQGHHCRREDLVDFFFTKVNGFHWIKKTHLFVVCNEQLPVYHYSSDQNSHAEMKFINDLERQQAFKDTTQFELYINYTPCHWQGGCCEALANAQRLQHRTCIYAVGMFDKEKIREDEFNEENWQQKIKKLKDAGIELKVLGAEQRKTLLTHLVPTHCNAFVNEIEKHERAIYESQSILKTAISRAYKH